MKRSLLLAAALLCAASMASAAPFAVTPLTGPAGDAGCRFEFNAGAAVNAAPVVDTVNGLPANGNLVCSFDVASAPVGANTIKTTLVSPIWGSLGVVTFPFSRPAAAVGTTRLSP